MNRPDLYKIANVWHEVEKASYPRQESRLILQTLRLVAKGQPRLRSGKWSR